MIVVPPLVCTITLDLLLLLLLANKAIEKSSPGHHFSLSEEDFAKLYPSWISSCFLSLVYKVQSSWVQDFLSLLLSASDTLGKLNLKWSPFLIVPKFLDFLGGWALLLAFCMLSVSILSELIVLFVIKPRVNELAQLRIGSSHVIPNSEQYWQSVEKDRHYFHTLEQVKNHSLNLHRRMSTFDSSDELTGRLKDVLACFSSQHEHLNASRSTQSIPSRIYQVYSSLASSTHQNMPNQDKFSSVFYPKLIARLNLAVASIDKQLAAMPLPEAEDQVAYRTQLIKEIECWKQTKKKTAQETLSMLGMIMRSFDLYHSAQLRCSAPSCSLSVNQTEKPLLEIIKDDFADLREKLKFLPNIKMQREDFSHPQKCQISNAAQFLHDTVDQLEKFYNQRNSASQDRLFLNQSLKIDTQSSYCHQAIKELHTFLDNYQLSSNKVQLLLGLCRSVNNSDNSQTRARHQSTYIDATWRHLAKINRDHESFEASNHWSLYAAV